MAMLEITGLSKHFGGVLAVDDLNMEVHQGEIVGLIGPNGAGKTTTFSLITGFLRPSAGKVVFNGKSITGLAPEEIAQAGIVRTFQASPNFKEFTVMENVLVAHHLQRRSGVLGTLCASPHCRREDRSICEKAEELLAYVGMSDIEEKIAQTCSTGYQKTLSIAMALSTSPRLLLLDEPMAALNPERVRSIMELIKKFRQDGVTVLIIEHNMRAIFDLCDRIVVLNYGHKIGEGTPAEIRNNKEVITAYLGATKYAT